MRGNIQRPFYFCSFLKWAQGALRRRHPSEEPGHIAQMERLFFYGKFSTMDEADWLRNEISICQNGLRTSKPGVQASPVTGKPLLASVAGHLNFQGVESPETVDAVGFQPTASILSAKVGGDGEIRTLDTLLGYTRFPIVRARPATRHLHIVARLSSAYELFA